MHKIFSLAILLIGVACKKPAAPPATPEVPPPSVIAAEADVKSSSGSVELTLLLHKTHIKAGDSLWYQLRLRNIGPDPLIIVDRVFRSGWNLRENTNARLGIFLEVQNAEGKPLKPAARSDMGDHLVRESSGMLEAVSAEAKAAVARWKKEGLSEDEIRSNLVQLNANRAYTDSDEPFRVELQPGGVIETKSWFFYHDSERIMHRPRPKPIGDFAELDVFDFDTPGRYRIRAVYDLAPGAYTKKLRGSEKAYADEVSFKSQWIDIEVSE